MSDTQPDVPETNFGNILSTCPYCGAARRDDYPLEFWCGTGRLAGDVLRQSTRCVEAERAKLKARIGELEAQCLQWAVRCKGAEDWIASLDEILPVNTTGRRQWFGGEIGWVPAGQAVYMGEAKP